MLAKNTPVTLTLYAVAALNRVKEHEEFAVAAAATLFANCLVLRMLGCELARPGKRGPIAASSRSASPLQKIASSGWIFATRSCCRALDWTMLPPA